MIILDWLVEYWLPVKGYEGLYEVSNWGRVRSTQYHRGTTTHLLSPSIKKNGYVYVTLCKNKKTHTLLVHRLVAEAFLPNTDGLPQVNHKNENKLENYVWNLEWCTQKYNVNYGAGIRKMLNSRNDKKGKTAERPIIQYSKNGEYIGRFNSQTEAAKELGISQGNINSCLNNNRYTAGGYKWEYE